MLNNFFSVAEIKKLKQEGPEGPGMLT